MRLLFTPVALLALALTPALAPSEPAPDSRLAGVALTAPPSA